MDNIRGAATKVAATAASLRSVTLLLRSGSLSPQRQALERGQGLAEYALILALIAIVAIVSLALLGANITNLFWNPINEAFEIVVRDILGIT